MMADKVTFTVTIEVLHIDSVPAILNELACQVSNGNTGGKLNKDDGDTVYWSNTTMSVSI